MEQLLLIRGVREVSLRAAPNAPASVSQRAFDTARSASDFPDLPPARNIARALGVPWAEVLELAHESEVIRTKRIGRKQGSTPLDWLDDKYVVFALRLVARRLGTRSLSLSDFRAERERMLTADRARYLHGRQLHLPNDEQVITYVGSWPAALRLAGLEPPPPGLKSNAEHLPTLVEAIRRFHEYYGTRPTKRTLEAFGIGNGIPYQRNTTFTEALAAWDAERTAQGLPVAPEPPARSERPDYSRDVCAARSDERRFIAERTLEECVAWMRRYLDDLPAGARSTQRSYRDWSRKQAGAPGPSTIGRHGGFKLIRSLAQDEIRAAGRI